MNKVNESNRSNRQRPKRASDATSGRSAFTDPLPTTTISATNRRFFWHVFSNRPETWTDTRGLQK